MQALWKVGAAELKQQTLLVDGLELRYKECVTEKNCTLIRFDIIQSLRNLYDAVEDDRVRAKALALIEVEDELKYRKKYVGLWRTKWAGGVRSMAPEMRGGASESENG